MWVDLCMYTLTHSLSHLPILCKLASIFYITRYNEIPLSRHSPSLLNYRSLVLHLMCESLMLRWVLWKRKSTHPHSLIKNGCKSQICVLHLGCLLDRHQEIRMDGEVAISRRNWPMSHWRGTADVGHGMVWDHGMCQVGVCRRGGVMWQDALMLMTVVSRCHVIVVRRVISVCLWHCERLECPLWEEPQAHGGDDWVTCYVEHVDAVRDVSEDDDMDISSLYLIPL